MDKVPARSLPTRASGAGWKLAESLCPADYPAQPRCPSSATKAAAWPTRSTETVRARSCWSTGCCSRRRCTVRWPRALAERGNRVVTLDLLGHGRSDRPQDMTRYSMPFFGRADDRAARPPRGRRGGAGRDLAGRQRDPRGGGARAGARARHGGRDARARQRAAGLRDRLHAADGRPDLRRARHAPRRPRRADGPQRRRPAAGRRRPGHHPPGPRRPARRSCTGCSSVARRRTRRCAARSPRRPSSSATRATRSTPSATPTRWSPSCRTPACVQASSILELRISPERLTGEIGDFLDTCWKARRRGGASRARRVA